MSLELTITAKGQVTLRRSLLEHLGVRPGDKVGISLLPDGRVEIVAAKAGHDLQSLYGAAHRPGRTPVSLAEMEEAIEAGRRS